MTQVKCVVIHFGTTNTIAGFSNRELPECILPSCYLKEDDEDELHFGLFNLLQRSKGNIYQIFGSDGLPYDWNAFEKLVSWIYNTQLHCKFDEFPLLITIPPNINNVVKSQLLELFLLKLNVCVIQLIPEPLALTLSLGRNTGIVVDIGGGRVCVTPVTDGSVINSGVLQSKFGGDFLDWQISQLVDDNVDDSKSSLKYWQNSRTWIQEFKINMLEISSMRLDDLTNISSNEFGYQSSMNSEKNYLMKQKRTITWNLRKCYEVGETIFRPSRVDEKFKDEDGLADLVVKSIKTCSANVMKNFSNTNTNTTPTSNKNTPIEQIYSGLLTNIIITGGTSLINGLEQRLINELSLQFPQYKLSSFAAPMNLDRMLQSWQSGVTICNLSEWHLTKWISKQDYLEDNK